jgi:hypothetical protein
MAATGTGPVVAGGVLMLVGLAGMWLADGEMLRREHIAIDASTVRFERRGLDGVQRWEEPLANYPGLEALDRARRYHLRNQERPATGRCGPVSEFVVVLRHRDGAARSRRWPRCTGCSACALRRRPARDARHRPMRACSSRRSISMRSPRWRGGCPSRCWWQVPTPGARQ